MSCRKFLRNLLFCNTLFIFSTQLVSGQGGPGTIIMREGFETGLPTGWVQEFIHSPDGFNAHWNTRKGAGVISTSANIFGDPDTAAVGSRNLVFQWEGIGHVTNLITRPINLEFAVKPELTFWHAQNLWGVDGPDKLWIHYRQGDTGPWVPLTASPFSTPVEQWTPRIFLLPSGSDKFYLRLQGTSKYGMGICIDDFTITETGIVPRALSHVLTTQAATSFVSTGSNNNVILRSEFRVTGNTDQLLLQTFTVRSANTNDADIAPNGVKIYFTENEVFHTNNLVGTATGFTGGQVVFNNLNLNLPTGYSYIWVVYDVDVNANAGNVVDAFIPANGIFVSGGPGYSVPSSNQHPPGWREIYKTIFQDDFETHKGWLLTGEWERDSARGLPTLYGFPDPVATFNGTRMLGTDITGLGLFHSMYEPMIDSFAYKAISPVFDCFYYTNVVLTFQEWLNIEFTDKAYIHVSTDGGTNWFKVWENDNFFTATNWRLRTIPIPRVNRKANVHVRFSLGPTDNTSNHSGWNIDNVFITGTFVTRDVGVSGWISPGSRCGMTNSEAVRVRINNFGAGIITDPIPVRISLNGGQTWQTDIVNQSIPVGGSIEHTFVPRVDFSAPGRYNNIIVRTMLEGDQDANNDAFHHQLLSIPIFTPPYYQSFSANDGLWNSHGHLSSWHRATPGGTVISSAYNDLHAWITNAAGPYNSGEQSWLATTCFNFSTMENPVLEFFINHHTPLGMDGVSLQYRLNNSDTWLPVQLLAPEFGWNWFNPPAITRLNLAFGQPNGWHGNSGGWRRVRAVLDSLVAQEPMVQFRFIFAANEYPPGTNTWEGVAIDAFNVYQAPNDVGITEIVHPINSCELSTQQPVTVRIKNHGHNTIQSGTIIPVGININSLPPVIENKVLQNNLSPGQTTTFTFNTTFNLSAVQTHNLTAYTLLPGDTDFYFPGTFNDTLSAQVRVFGYTNFSLGNDIYTTRPDTLIIDAGAGFQAYLWNDGSINRTFNVTSMFNAQYWVTITDTNGCNSTDTIRVISQDIALSGILSPTSACELSANEPLNILLRNNGHATLPAGHPLPLVVQVNETVLFEETIVLTTDWPVSTELNYLFTNTLNMEVVGLYNIKVFQKNRDANMLNDTISASIRNQGYPVVGLAHTVITNQPDTLILDAGAGHFSYLWCNGSTTQTLHVPAWGTYHVEVTNIFGCITRDTTRVVPVLLGFTVTDIISPSSFCNNNPNQPVEIRLQNTGNSVIPANTEVMLTFSANGSQVLQEVFVLQSALSVNDFRNFVFTQKFTATTTGPVLLRAEVPHQSSLEKLITIHPQPTVNLGTDIYTTRLDTVALDAGSGFVQYLWHNGTTTQNYFPNSFGWKWVNVLDQFGCKAGDTIFVGLIVYTPEINNIAPIAVIFPNPAKNELNIKLSLPQQDMTQIEVYDMLGELKINNHFIPMGQKATSIDISPLESGIYFIRIKSSRFTTTQKFTKIR